jgi:hypothetical protein
MAENGELSKNALKKKMKQDALAKKKAEKDALRKTESEQHASNCTKDHDDEELDPTQYYENRLRALGDLEVCARALWIEMRWLWLHCIEHPCYWHGLLQLDVHLYGTHYLSHLCIVVGGRHQSLPTQISCIDVYP